MNACQRILVWAGLAGGLLASDAAAEPYLAVQQGYACSQCHVNATGGGMRNAFGNIYAQNVMPARRVEVGVDGWTGKLNSWFAVGGNVRAQWTGVDVPSGESSNEFDVGEARLFLLAEPLPDRLAIYLDERVAPGAATTLEAWVRLATSDRRWSLRAGRMYLPFGLRLEDDSAFTRQLSGLNMTTPDDGAEIGWESGGWSAQFAVANGGAGGPEADDGKQWTGQLVKVQSSWRLGLSGSYNDAEAGDRSAAALFGGLRTGPVAWLAELDYVHDEGAPDGTRELLAGLLEANLQPRRGHNLKLTGEWFDPDADLDEDEQTRWSLVYEYVPMQWLQLRAGARFYEGIPQNDLQNRRSWFAELHGFF